MGCAPSKRIEAAVEIYRPAPTSFAVFDINAIREPWVTVDNTAEEHQEKPTHVPAPLLEKLNKLETETDAPHSWDEVSKALEDLKPTLNNQIVVATKSQPPPPQQNDSNTDDDSPSPPFQKRVPRKSMSFHTLEELDQKANVKKPTNGLRKTESFSDMKKTGRPELRKTEFSKFNKVAEETTTTTMPKVSNSLKDNIFILKDRTEREKEGKQAIYDRLKRDPLKDFPEHCPPGGADSVVVYTTSLRGVRRTFDDCTRIKNILEGHRIVFDERDVSLHGEFLSELKEMLGEEGVSVPKVFVKGRYVGGVEEVSEMNESGKLGRIMGWARVERGVGWQVCEGCGGARFVPCMECGGSCKVVVNGVKEKCGKCNENGLARCPGCCVGSS